jgi:hypothetical protein
LLERANAVSRPTYILPNYRHDLTFRSYGLDGTAKDGRFNGIFSGDIERYELFFGDYHAIRIDYPDKIVQNDDYQPTPLETMEMDKLTPLLIGNFDKSDTIHIANALRLSRQVHSVRNRERTNLSVQRNLRG